MSCAKGVSPKRFSGTRVRMSRKKKRMDPPQSRLIAPPAIRPITVKREDVSLNLARIIELISQVSKKVERIPTSNPERIFLVRI